MTIILHEEKLKEDLRLVVERTSDPENPGIYAFVMKREGDGHEKEVGTILLELHEGKVYARVWNEDEQGCDPIVIPLHTYKDEEDE